MMTKEEENAIQLRVFREFPTLVRKPKICDFCGKCERLLTCDVCNISFCDPRGDSKQCGSFQESVPACGVKEGKLCKNCPVPINSSALQ